MAFPVTLNGRTYTLADFAGQNYVDGLPDAFEDFVTQAGDIYNSTSTSSVAIGTGSKSFTTADSGKPYQPGTPLRIADAAAPSTNFMDCIVTSYSGTSLVVDAIGYAGSGTKSSWTINIGGTKTAAGTVVADSGSFTGSVTIDGDLTVDSQMLYVDSTNNRVGIQTASPTLGTVQIGRYQGTDWYIAFEKYFNTESGLKFYRNSAEDGSIVMTASENLEYTVGTTLGTSCDHIFKVNGTTEALRVAGNGNVGIGYDSPNSKLHVRADAAGDYAVRIGNAEGGSGSVQGVSRLGFDSGNGTATYAHADISIEEDGTASFKGELVFRTRQSNSDVAPIEAMRIDSSGNVGIGETAPTAAIGGKALEVQSSTGADVIVGNTTSVISNNTYIGAYLFENGDASGSPPHYAGMWSKSVSEFGEMDLRFSAGRDNYESGVHHLIIDREGKVGVQSGNTPVTTFSVVGTNDATYGLANFTASDGLGAHVTVSRGGSSQGGFKILRGGNADSYWEVNAAETTVFGYNGGDTNDGLAFVRGTAQDTTMFLDSSGNVGIGNTNPAYSLHIGDGTATEILAIQASNTGKSHIFFGDAADVDAGRISYDHSIDAYLFTNNGNQERMRLDSSGNLLVARTSGVGSERFAVSGAAVAATFYSANSTNNGSLLTFYSDVGSTENLVAIMQRDGDILNNNNSYGAISDARLKSDIVDASPQLDDIMAIRVRSYTLNSTGAKHIGVVAQELEEAGMGSLVSTDEEGMKSVKYSIMYMKAIKAIQEQQAMIEELKAEVAALKGA